MNGEHSPTWGDIWARSDEATRPRYEWPDWYIEIHRAIGTPEEEIAAFAPPTEELTMDKFMAGVVALGREHQRRALLEWLGHDLNDGPPSPEVREAFNARCAAERARCCAEFDALCERVKSQGLDYRAERRRANIPTAPQPLAA
jgi:hypothetical protein